MAEVHLWRWRSSRFGENFGDWLSVPLIEAMGHTVAEPVDSAMFAVGSSLEANKYAMFRGRIDVWGTGIGVSDVPPSNAVFHAVRGPLTRRLLNLPSNLPLGDPALLLPQLMKLPSTLSETLYMNHIWSDPMTVDGCVGISARNPSLYTVARIANAAFVASEAFHGCVVASAYGVPWSPCSPTYTDFEPKRYDWAEYLGLPKFIRWPRTLPECRRWWDNIGRYGRVRDLGPLLDVFPCR